MASIPRETRRFGQFELDIDAGEFRRNGRRVKLQPQPFKLLVLLTRRAGSLVTRDEIRSELWPDGTFVDFDQSVNFAVKQIRDAMGDAADRPLYVETVPRQGYRFIAPVDTGEPPVPSPAPGPRQTGTTMGLQKAVWANIAELRMLEARRRKVTYISIAAVLTALAVLTVYVVLRVR